VARKSNSKVAVRTREQILAEMTATEATCIKLRLLLEQSLSAIRSSRFTLWIVDEDGKKKRNPALKDLRELEGTHRSAHRHLASLRAEMDALIGSGQAEKSALDEFTE